MKNSLSKVFLSKLRFDLRTCTNLKEIEEVGIDSVMFQSTYAYMHNIYIYIYIERERERDR